MSQKRKDTAEKGRWNPGAGCTETIESPSFSIHLPMRVVKALGNPMRLWSVTALSRRLDQLTFRGLSQPKLCCNYLKPSPLNLVRTYELDLLLPYRHGAILFANHRGVQLLEAEGSLSKRLARPWSYRAHWKKFFQKSIKNWQKSLRRSWSFCKRCLQYLQYFWLNRVQFSWGQISSQQPEYLINSHCKPFQSVEKF